MAADRVALALALALALAGAAAAAEELTICVEGPFPPFTRLNDQGALEGFDIDIAGALCAEMGVECRLRTTRWEALIEDLSAGRCDAIVASMAITEERLRHVDFSEKYHEVPVRFVGRDGAGLEATPEGLAGKRICLQAGSTSQRHVEEKFPEAELRLYDSQDEAFVDLADGRCDATISAEPTLRAGFLDRPEGAGFALFGPNQRDPAIHGHGSGVAVRKGEIALADRFSAAIRAIRANGVYAAINDRYFDVDVYGD